MTIEFYERWKKAIIKMAIFGKFMCAMKWAKPLLLPKLPLNTDIMDVYEYIIVFFPNELF